MSILLIIPNDQTNALDNVLADFDNSRFKIQNMFIV